MAIGVSGLISDGRRLCKYMMQETLNYKYVFNKEMPVQRLVVEVADKMQVQTQISSGRPYGAGLLVIGYDESGPHLFETDPAGQYFEYWGHSIGARNQAAKTYLERHYASFEKLSSKDLIQHGVQALKETVRTKNLKLTTDNTSVMIVGKDTDLHHLNEEELETFVKNVEGDDDTAVQSQPKQDGDSNQSSTDATAGSSKEPMDEST
jgi:20S proteasome subunit alpha 6